MTLCGEEHTPARQISWYLNCSAPPNFASETVMVSFASPVRGCLTIASIVFTATIATAQPRTDFGTLSIQVRPPEAEILIDGERWTGSEANAPLQVQLSPGTHRVEMRAPGRQTFSATVTIRSGQTTPLNVSLLQIGPESAPPEPAPASPPVAPASTPRPRGSEGGLHVTTGEDGFMIAPDYRVTDINHHTAQLLGAYGGYVFGRQFLVGAGGYWQVDSTDGLRIAYGGPVFEWRIFPDKAVGLNLHGLIGGGWRYADDSYFANFGRPRLDHRGVPAGRNNTLPYGFYDDAFFVAEPDAQVVVRLASWIRLQGGVGYRATSSDNTNGASGSVSVQFGR
jgi:PEGA domain-containing protein